VAAARPQTSGRSTRRIPDEVPAPRIIASPLVHTTDPRHGSEFIDSKMRLRAICTSKIHHATVTEANVAYIGSIGIDAALLERADIKPGEKVGVWNVNNGARIETYAIPAPQGSGEIVVNGAAARHFQVGDKVIIVAFTLTDEHVEPRMFLVGERNEFAGWLRISAEPDAVQEEIAAPAEEL
jgi:aspartate 1-decarboxylase